MYRRFSLALMLLALGCTSLSAAEKTAVSLAHKFTVGETVRYKIVQEVRGANKSVPVAYKLISVVKVRCTQLTDDIGTLEVGFESNKLMIGKREANAFPGMSGPRVLQVTSRGKVLFPAQTPLTPSEMRRILMDTIEPLIILANLPDQPVVPMDSWAADVALPSTAVVKIKSTLQEIKDSEGEAKAVILQSQTTGEVSPNVQVARSTLVFGMTSGRLLSAQGTTHSVIDSYTLDSQYTVELLKE